MRTAAAFGAVVMLALPVAAQEGEFVPGPYIELLAECYGAAGDAAARTACIGEAAATCIEEEPRGRSPDGRLACIAIEADAWDTVLAGEYQLTMEWARRADAAEPSAAADLPRRADALRAAQTAWQDFFEAEGRLVFALSGPGAAAEGRLAMIAGRAVALKRMREPE